MAKETDNGREERAKPYEAPSVVRVRVETGRMATGVLTALTHCTQHFHDSNIGVCQAT